MRVESSVQAQVYCCERRPVFLRTSCRCVSVLCASLRASACIADPQRSSASTKYFVSSPRRPRLPRANHGSVELVLLSSLWLLLSSVVLCCAPSPATPILRIASVY